MKSRTPANKNAIVKNTLACAAIGWICLSAANFCIAQSETAIPPSVSPDLQEVVTLSKNHMGDDVITNYINNTGKTYKLSADDIIYLNSQGVSKGVISTLLETASSPPPSGGNPANPPAAALPPNTNPTPTAAAPFPVPPPLEDSPGSPNIGSAPVATAAAPVATPTEIPQPSPAPMAPALAPTAPAVLQDNFFADTGLNPALWQTRSPVLTMLASFGGTQVLPALAFSPSGMQMSGIRGRGQFMGIQSTASFAPPFTFNATVTGMAQSATPFEIYLVSADLRQWVSIAGHLGGVAPREHVVVGGLVRMRVLRPADAIDYGIWINNTGSGLPISALGYKFSDDPLAGVPYTVQISAGADGAASVSLLDARGGVLAAKNVPVGTGPFYIVLAGRDGPTFANWQSVQLTQPAPPVAEAPAVPATPSLDYFQGQLAPYGSWVTVPGYGLCWQPVALNVGWRPYYDGGHWEYTDAGWYWASDYPWGDIAFHYGRWAYTPSGWVWIPGYDYAPAWVFWRHADADGYVGWAPLPYGAVFVGGGWVFNGVHVGVDFDFGLGVNFFTFVGCDHFWEHDFRVWVVPHDRVELIFRHSVIEDHFRRDEHGRFVNEGLARDRMAALTHHEIHAVALHDVREREEHRNVLARREDIHEFKAGAKPNAMRTAEAKTGTREGAEREHEMTPGKNPAARTPEMERGNRGPETERGKQEPGENRISHYPGAQNNNGRESGNAAKYQKGQPPAQNGGKGGGNDSRDNKDRNGN